MYSVFKGRCLEWCQSNIWIWLYLQSNQPKLLDLWRGLDRDLPWSWVEKLCLNMENWPPAVTRASRLQSMCISRSHIHALGKQFIRCHIPLRIAPHPTEFTIQLVLCVGNRCNQPCYATVIPMTLQSAVLSQVTALYTAYQMLKCPERNTMT